MAQQERDAIAEFKAQQAQEAQAREERGQADAEARQAKAQADFDARHKVPALRAWVASGGDPADFETAWPAQAQQIRMAESVRQTEEGRETMRRLIQDF